MSANLSASLYLISGVLLSYLKRIVFTKTSRRGNLFGILGMLIAVQLHFIYW